MDITDVNFFTHVNDLRSGGVLDIYSKRWFECHKNLVSINLYLHRNSEMMDTIGDERIDALMRKFETLVRELITTYFVRFIHTEELTKCTKDKILEQEIGGSELQTINGDGKNGGDTTTENRISSYISLYHEVTLLNIVERILCADHAYDKINNHMINLFAYIYSNLVAFLKSNSEEYFSKPISEMSISEMLIEENDKSQNIDRLKIYMCVINALRNITDRIHLLNNTIINKIVDYDVLLILIPLLEKRPWEHGNYVFEGNEWVKREGNTLCTIEKQLWLILYTLILTRNCQEKYEMTNYRRNNILKLRKYMNEPLHEQLPPMKTLHTFIEHLYISKSIFPENKNSYLIIDVVPEIFEEIKEDVLKNKKKLASLLSTVTIDRALLGGISDMYLSVYEFDQQGGKGAKNDTGGGPHSRDQKGTDYKRGEAVTEESFLCDSCKEIAELQCSQCKRAYYCSKECQMKDWFHHRQVCSYVT
ncbi:MYND finger protein, putative [Plasmodium knowlesi strain H]|uniref:MYND finger protein, putative n=3 Tax=Plasmodium knowlesi TaxID=5850 RepID=A0A5K1UY97_PLAKH|nr:MYND-type zinc finger protein, putative [Plasmodium knowlesi strain H]OTN64583.1 putative MYND finger protein [Plasmodium knowlesi]CAA9989258.1 MYND-type zinc finger protein, putative [Plasmodium knowlesi strain H]SBO26172.1 MYND finger protein, putative [Plasmodium knowlesi strain H]VVS78732.1 MYND-type zinc finger protein, putative [Plasmodium knowlesi strain H]|eukprot:XP_002261604.1 Mynd finger protein, putative [Plasmodium knowlesi strain H]